MSGRSLILLLLTAIAAIAPPARGDLLVANGSTAQVLRYDATTGAFLGVFAQDTGYIQGLVAGPDGNIYVSNLISQSVERFNGATGASLGTFVPSGSGGLDFPHDLAFGPNNNLFVASGETASILQYDGKTGAFLGKFAAGTGTGMAFFGNGLYVAFSAQDPHILEFNATTGASLGTFASGQGLNQPAGLTFDAAGDLFVANFGANNVLEFDPSGTLIRTLVAPDLIQPGAATFGPDGKLYVSGFGSDTIDVFDPTTGAYLRTFASGGPLAQPLHLIFTPAAVPEPTGLALLGLGAGLGMVAAACAGRRRAPGL
jgi:DNA-binding beta-propeller fold protein YncE